MELITGVIKYINGIVWGPLMLTLILGTGFFLMVGLKFMPLIRLKNGFQLLWQGRSSDKAGEITPFNALMTSLSATVGTGNIAGVATAIAIGGPGALFWMWLTALVGMATKYAEAVCAVHYREVDEHGNYLGGPMYYIKNGLGKKWLWLGTAFALFGFLAAFGIGNTVQANSVAHVLLENFEIPEWLTSLVLVILTALVVIGGIKRIAVVAGKLVPFMAALYLLAGTIVLIINFAEIPAAVSLIVESAFTGTAAQGGFAGAAVWAAIRFGVARGIFSNEAGLGSAPIAHAAAKTNSPVRQGMVAMLGTFLDTLIICTITGLVIVTSGAWTTGVDGAALTSAAFSVSLAGMGGVIVSVSLALFAYTTILGWSVYGERCVEYLFGLKTLAPYRVLFGLDAVVYFRLFWVVAIPFGAMSELKFIWLLADTLNAMMALPNLIALILLSPVIFKLTSEYFANKNQTANA